MIQSLGLYFLKVPASFQQHLPKRFCVINHQVQVGYKNWRMSHWVHRRFCLRLYILYLNEFHLNVQHGLTDVTNNIHIHIISVKSWVLSYSPRNGPLFTVCGAAPGFVSGWHHHHSLSLCELQCLSGVLLWWNVVIYFHGVPSFPLPASSTSTSLSDCLHRMPFNSPQTIGLNFFFSVEGLDM